MDGQSGKEVMEVPQLLVKCDDCGTIVDYTALSAAKWKCTGCGACIGQPGSERQIEYARGLGVEAPETMCVAELTSRIAEQKRLLEEESRARRAGLIEEADANALLRELQKRGFQFVMLASGAGSDVRRMQLVSTSDYPDPVGVLTQYALLIARGEIAVRPHDAVFI